MGDDHHGYGFEIQSPAFERIVQRINPGFEFETKTVLRKDSLDITGADRKLILSTCQESSADKIVITHGTDTMIQTAEALKSLKDKVVVITGAMSPERFKDSDADFNFGFAVAAVSTLPNGSYIAMNGRIFKADDVVFDEDSNQFISTST